jgi:Undecaprenyl-phosphate glucose phosphotransferase
MNIVTGTPSSSTSAAISSAVISGDAARPTSAHTTRWAIVRAKIMAMEFLAVASAAFVASFTYNLVTFSMLPVPQYIFAALFIATLVSLVSMGFKHFTAIKMRPLHVLLWSGIGAVGLAFALLLSTIFLLKVAEGYSRGTFIFQIICVGVAVTVVRAISYSWLRSAIASGAIEARHVVLIGEATRCAQFSDRLRTSAIQCIASFHLPWDRDVAIGGDDTNYKDQKVRRLIENCRAIRPDDIIVLATQEELPKAIGLASILSELPVALHVAPTDALELLAGSQIVEFGSLKTIQVSRPPLSSFDLLVKRSFDVLAATVGLIVLSPLFLVVSIAIKLDSYGPVFFRQNRHGFNNEPIRVLKFRSMTVSEDGDQFAQVVKHDGRVTRVGWILRRTNIDELPQLINVLYGDMSIVGPRPHPTALNRSFEQKIPPLARRHKVKPGITGWAQINGFRGETDTLEKMQRRLECDLYYIDNWSFLFDLKIILLTLVSKRAYVNAY